MAAARLGASEQPDYTSAEPLVNSKEFFKKAARIRSHGLRQAFHSRKRIPRPNVVPTGVKIRNGRAIAVFYSLTDMGKDFTPCAARFSTTSAGRIDQEFWGNFVRHCSNGVAIRDENASLRSSYV
jgi:hypothetical protein